MQPFDQHESAGLGKQPDSNAPTSIDAVHLLSRGIEGGAFRPQSILPDGITPAQDLLAQLAGDSASSGGPRRSLSGLPMTEGGLPAQPRTYDQMDKSIEYAKKYWAGLV